MVLPKKVMRGIASRVWRRPARTVTVRTWIAGWATGSLGPVGPAASGRRRRSLAGPGVTVPWHRLLAESKQITSHGPLARAASLGPLRQW